MAAGAKGEAMQGQAHSLFQLHVAVLLFGLAGLFGKLLSLSPFLIVLGRAFFAALTLGLVFLGRGRSLRLESRGDALVFIGLGALLATHWTTFFQAIQVSTVAIGLVTFATFPAFVTFMEPPLFKEKLRAFDLLTAGLVAIGIVWVVPDFRFAHHVAQGAFWGTLSGFTFALLSLLNRKYVKTYPSPVIAFYQNALAALVLLPFLAAPGVGITSRDLVLIVFLGLFCTALAHGLFITSLKRIRAQLASVTACLEPVYGILFAWVLLHEVPAPRTLLGGAVILTASVLASLRSKTDGRDPSAPGRGQSL
jgi:drug/metabolite transporter (DMT)-like permease